MLYSSFFLKSQLIHSFHSFIKNLPAQLGPIISPTENEEVTIDIPMAIFESSHIEHKSAFTATIKPIQHPCKNLVITAQYRLLLKPNAKVVADKLNAVKAIVNFFPLVSAIIPQAKL